MTEQLSLFGSDDRRRAADRLFFAVLADASAAAHIARLVTHLRSEHRLTGKPLGPDRLHISLYHLGDHAGVRQDIIARADEAATAVTMPPFVVAFDHAGSFSGKPGKRPLVLSGHDGVVGLMAFHQSLGAEAMLGLGPAGLA